MIIIKNKWSELKDEHLTIRNNLVLNVKEKREEMNKVFHHFAFTLEDADLQLEKDKELNQYHGKNKTWTNNFKGAKK